MVETAEVELVAKRLVMFIEKLEQRPGGRVALEDARLDADERKVAEVESDRKGLEEVKSHNSELVRKCKKAETRPGGTRSHLPRGHCMSWSKSLEDSMQWSSVVRVCTNLCERFLCFCFQLVLDVSFFIKVSLSLEAIVMAHGRARRRKAVEAGCQSPRARARWRRRWKPVVGGRRW